MQDAAFLVRRTGKLLDKVALRCGCTNVGSFAPIQTFLLLLYWSSMKPIEIQPANSSDYDEITDVWHASASLPGVGPVPMVPRETLRARIEPEVANGWHMTVARADGEIVGFLAVNTGNKVLSQIFVRPDFIGSGLGGRLLRLAMKQMPLGFTLSTASTNDSARKFYEKSGFIMRGTDVHPRTGHEISFYEWIGQ